MKYSSVLSGSILQNKFNQFCLDVVNSICFFIFDNVLAVLIILLMQENRHFFDISKLLEQLISSYDLETTLNILAKNIAELMGVKGCTVRLLDKKTMMLEIVAAHAFVAGLSKSAKIQ